MITVRFPPEESKKSKAEVVLLTVMATVAEVVWFPAASRATAIKVCDPFVAVVVFQDTEYGEIVSSAPRALPSSLNCTPATPTLSEALAETLTVPETVAPPLGAETDTEGAVVSDGGGGGGGTVPAECLYSQT